MRHLGGHPALLMWALGNELGLSDPAKRPLLDFVNELAGLIQEEMLAVHGRTVPITTCDVDLPESYDLFLDVLYENGNFTLFCTNAGYRGDYTCLFFFVS